MQHQQHALFMSLQMLLFFILHELVGQVSLVELKFGAKLITKAGEQMLKLESSILIKY